MLPLAFKYDCVPWKNPPKHEKHYGNQDMACPQDADQGHRFQTRMVAENMLNKQSRISKKGFYSNFEADLGLKTTHHKRFHSVPSARVKQRIHQRERKL
jgi:hypothetical protein